MDLVSEIKRCENFKQLDQSLSSGIGAVGISFWGNHYIVYERKKDLTPSLSGNTGTVDIPHRSKRYVVYEREKIEIDLLINAITQRGFELFAADKLDTLENREYGEHVLARLKVYKEAAQKTFPGNWFVRLLEWLRQKGFFPKPSKPVYPVASPFRLFKDTDWTCSSISVNHTLVEWGRYHDELFEKINPIRPVSSNG
jgi:hypothetical protein